MPAHRPVPERGGVGASQPRWPYLSGQHPLAMAHRGGPGPLPENSMAAFERAVRLGYGYVETDVRATSDGVLLAFHDARLDRVTDLRGRVAALPWRQVRRARLAGGEPIPLLEEVLATWPRLRLNIDVKAPTAVRPLLDVLRRTGAMDRVCVAAFSDARVRAVRRAAGPRLATALAPGEVAALRLASLNGRSGGVRVHAACAQVPVSFRGVPVVDARFVAAAHRAGLEVHVWTVNRRAQMSALLDLGVDGLVTDELETLAGLLADRGRPLTPLEGA